MSCNCGICDCFDLGCFYHNNPKLLNIFAEISGLHEFILSSALCEFKFYVSVWAGEMFEIPEAVNLNENMQYNLTIIDPAGAKIEYGGKNCFKFKVETNYMCGEPIYYGQ